jgi:hypothetical protein
METNRPEIHGHHQWEAWNQAYNADTSGMSSVRRATMARVVTGRIEIPGEKLSEYLQALEDAEQAAAPFRNQLERFNREFERSLQTKFSPRTARKHASIIEVFIDFVCWQTDVRSIDEITRGIANSSFRTWYRRKTGEGSESELKTAVKKFFQFLDKEKGITNEAVLKSFQ